MRIAPLLRCLSGPEFEGATEHSRVAIFYLEAEPALLQQLRCSLAPGQQVTACLVNLSDPQCLPSCLNRPSNGWCASICLVAATLPQVAAA